MLRSFRAWMLDETGAALVDAMVGVIIAGLAVSGLATISVVTSSAIKSTTQNSSLVSDLTSYANRLATDPANVAGPALAVSISMTMAGTTTDVTAWLETVAGARVIYATAPKWGSGKSTTCAPTITAPDNNCVYVQVAIPVNGPRASTIPTSFLWANPDVASPAGALISAGPIGAFTSVGATAEARYVVRVTATDAGTITFTDTVTGLLLKTISFPAGTDTYFYGTVTAGISSGAGNQVAVALTGSQARLSHLYVYEAPR
jgi:hypothetical protein